MPMAGTTLGVLRKKSGKKKALKLCLSEEFRLLSPAGVTPELFQQGNAKPRESPSDGE